MKRSVFSVSAIFLFIGIVSFWLVSKNKTVYLHQFVPPETLVYFDQHNLGELYSQSKDKSFIQAIKAIDFVSVSLDVGIDISYVEAIREILQFSKTDFFSELFDLFLSDHFSLALLPPHFNTSRSASLADVVLLCTPKKKLSLHSLSKKLDSEDLVTSSTGYGEHIITHLNISDKADIYCVAISNKLLVTLDKRTIRYALDIHDEVNREKLLEDYFYSELEVKRGESETFLFIASENIIHVLSKLIAENRIPFSFLEKILPSWKGVSAVGYSATYEDSMRHDSIELYYNKSLLKPHTADLLEEPSTLNPHIKVAPKDTLLYYWANTFNLPTMWKIYGEESGEEQASINFMESAISDLFGIPFEELLQLTGKNIHIILRQSTEKNILPVPNLTLMLDINNSNKTELLLNDFFKRNTIPQGNGVYRNMKFYYWGEEIQHGFQPIYSFHDSNILLSSSLQMFKSIVDSISDNTNVINSSSFAITGAELLQKNNSITYIQFSSLVDVMNNLIKYAAALLAIENPQKAPAIQAITREIILPLLNGMKMYETIAIRSYTDKGILHIDSKTLLSH